MLLTLHEDQPPGCAANYELKHELNRPSLRIASVQNLAGEPCVADKLYLWDDEWTFGSNAVGWAAQVLLHVM